jgi:hypothetical protein
MDSQKFDLALGLFDRNERDPRKDPKVGDVLQKGSKIRTVGGRGESAGYPDATWGVEFIRTEQHFYCYTLAGWRRWAASAEVIKKSEGGDK